MSLTSKIVNESPAARRYRLLAPLVALLALVALMMAPGIIAELREGAVTVGPVSQVVSPPTAGGAQRSAVAEL
jgi:hypothetical protein